MQAMPGATAKVDGVDPTILVQPAVVNVITKHQ
jgi:hypothetical protein